jgi:hypothetical protein
MVGPVLGSGWEGGREGGRKRRLGRIAGPEGRKKRKRNKERK